ncbi:2-hydroxyacid dehydrogenase [Amycolatopsis viridis]|uniref:Lactate dehydrogenase-like 2-hydroxyacid dehydrogenase n=1 Tax=Amycolatopsis viridis TaxID=185678 RepID=A0ABX0STV4_9PSEU|nr:NAD(P)-dependent oxidoreductase [Amycolatopsis viridis]NIH80303.1 lactate dehydrogenase-like 2-hydroxyacid dehydrogenase [Amycolatopsis viridis]
MVNPTVVSFPEWDHMLAAAADVMRGPDEATRRSLEAFFAPEVVDLDALFAAGRIPDVTIDMPAKGDTGYAPDAGTRVLVVRRTRVDRQLLDRLPDLRHVQKLGERQDTIDVAAAAERGITLDFVPRPALEATADHAVLLVMAALRELPRLDRTTRESTVAAGSSAPGSTAYNWPGVAFGRTLSASTVGIIGLGEVGLLVARRLRAAGARVVWTSLRGRPQRTVDGLEYLPLDDLLAVSDAVSLHIPSTADNRHVVDAAFLRKMRADAVLVNVSRGLLIDEHALAQALRRGELRFAALDVYGSEPVPVDNPLLDAERVILTPHVAGGPRSLMTQELLDLSRGVSRALAAGREVAR